MEFLLLWWDDLDDFAHACRHVATSAVFEAVAQLAPFAAVTSATMLATSAGICAACRHWLRWVA